MSIEKHILVPQIGRFITIPNRDSILISKIWVSHYDTNWESNFFSKVDYPTMIPLGNIIFFLDMTSLSRFETL